LLTSATAAERREQAKKKSGNNGPVNRFKVIALYGFVRRRRREGQQTTLNGTPNFSKAAALGTT
jgi:hypothetical protein